MQPPEDHQNSFSDTTNLLRALTTRNHVTNESITIFLNLSCQLLVPSARLIEKLLKFRFQTAHRYLLTDSGEAEEYYSQPAFYSGKHAAD